MRDVVYGFTAAEGRPPTVAEAAARLGIGIDAARAAFRWLEERDALLLEPGGEAIRMAKPFSGRATAFRVRANGRAYWANCAWDALGIPAALRADAVIEATLAEDGATARLTVADGRVEGRGEVIHVLRPLRTWHEDLVET